MRLLRVANSAAYANLSQVATAQEAVARLGTAQVLALAVAGGAQQHLQAEIPGYNLDEGALWRHSVAAAAAAEVAPRFCTANAPPEVFTAALLHDVGKVVMGRFLEPDALRRMAEAKEKSGLTQLQAESLLLGTHHGALGGLIAQHWKLPKGIVAGIAYHHDPTWGQSVICDYTYMANETARQIEAQLKGGKPFFLIFPDVASRLGVDQNRIGEYLAAAAARFTEVNDRYNAI